jgi:MarR family 2-MHQ and catechol resistance regulon transcriptional repressor
VIKEEEGIQIVQAVHGEGPAYHYTSAFWYGLGCYYRLDCTHGASLAKSFDIKLLYTICFDVKLSLVNCVVWWARKMSPSKKAGSSAKSFESPEVQAEALHLFRILLKAGRALEEHSQLSVESTGLCPTDFYILEALFHKGSMAAGVVAKKVLITLGSMSTALDRLERKGLVERRMHGADKRTRMIYLTEQGRDLVAGIFPAHALALTKAMSGLTLNEMKEAAELLKRLGMFADLAAK